LVAHPTRPGTEADLTTIQKLETGKRKLTEEWRDAIASALDVGPDDLMEVASKVVPVRRVPHVGRIAGGNWREAVEDATELVMTSKGGPNTFALTVDGDSMDRVVASGTTIFIDPDDRELRDGKFYAFYRDGGDTTFKKFRSSPLRLEPCSSNSEHKTILVGEGGLITLGRVVGAELDL